MPEHLGRHGGDVGDALLHRPPLDAEAQGEQSAQLGFVDAAAGLRVSEDDSAVEGRPCAVGVVDHVGGHDVGVEVRVALAGGAVPERGGDQLRASLRADPVLAPAGPSRCSFHVVEPRLDGLVVAVPDHPAEVRVAESEEEGHGLRCSEAEVVAGDAAVLGCELRPGGRVLAGDDGAQGVGVHLAVEAEVCSAGSEPDAGRLAVSEVVLLGAAGDRAEHVLRVGDLPDAQHDGHPVGTSRKGTRDADASEDATSCVLLAGGESARFLAGQALIGAGEAGLMAGVLRGHRGG